MNNHIKFFHSIHFKIALVFALMLLITLEVAGAVFVNQLEKQSVTSFKNQVQLPTYVNNSLANQLINSDVSKSNSNIRSLLSDVNTNNDGDEIQVVDNKSTIRGTNQVNEHDIVGQKTPNRDIRSVLYSSRTLNKTTMDSNNSRYYTVIIPLVHGPNNNTVGAVYIHASLNSVYRNINNITVIYLLAAPVTILLGLLVAIVISRAITRPIDDMRKQTIKIARGDYSGRVHVYSHDELGQLADAINNLSVKVRESQDSIESERRRLDSVLTNMNDGVLATDRRGNVIIVNSKALDFLRTKNENVIGHSILGVLNIKNKYSLRKLLKEPQEIVVDLSSKGHDLILHAHFSMIQRNSGFINGLVCVLHDVTEQQKIDADRKEFVSNVSHELRTPLTSVHAYLETLNEGAWKDSSVAPHFLKVAQDETERMTRMVGDLLTLSRMDSGTQKMNPELVNLNELFSYILNQFDMILNHDSKTQRGVQASKDYRIVRHLTKRDLWVEVDTDRFTQVIDNILNNAIKYSPKGGAVTCSLYETHNHVILSISDQGLGIPYDAQKHIFDRFYRVDKARSREQGGTGLGLAISKEVIEALGGHIWVESTEGKGSTFYISLPYEPIEEDLWDEENK